jgi:hypothetical protein
MSGKGKTVEFHGSFTSKRRATEKEQRVGGFIKAVTVRGKRRFVVMKKKKKRGT